MYQDDEGPSSARGPEQGNSIEFGFVRQNLIVMRVFPNWESQSFHGIHKVLKLLLTIGNHFVSKFWERRSSERFGISFLELEIVIQVLNFRIYWKINLHFSIQMRTLLHTQTFEPQITEKSDNSNKNFETKFLTIRNFKIWNSNHPHCVINILATVWVKWFDSRVLSQD